MMRGHFDCGFDLPLRHEVEAVGSEGTLRLSPAFGRDDGELTLSGARARSLSLCRRRTAMRCS